MEYVPFGNTDRIQLTIQLVQNLLCKPTRSGKRCSNTDATKFMMLCAARKLNPWEGDAYLVGYDGKDGVAEFSLITAEQAFLKRAELNPDYDGIESGVIVQNEDGSIEELQGEFTMDNQKCVGGWARLKVKNRTVPFYERLALRQYAKPSPFWDKNPQHQIAKCARVAVFRRAFATSLGNLYLQEEQDTEPMKRADAYEIPAHKLVDVVAPPPPDQVQNGQDADNVSFGSDATAKRATAVSGKSAGAELAAFVTDNGFTFDQFRQVAGGTGILTDADSLASWDEVKEADAKRVLRAKAGLLKQLETDFGDGETRKEGGLV